MVQFHLLAGWIGIALGMASGAVLGLFFHDQDWLGGYASWRRRMLRLAHISFFGTAFLNVAFSFALYVTDAGKAFPPASCFLLSGSVLMPAVCFLAAWRTWLRHLFVLPALNLLGAAIFTLRGLIP
jgi:hypothetical protein